MVRCRKHAPVVNAQTEISPPHVQTRPCLTGRLYLEPSTAASQPHPSKRGAFSALAHTGTEWQDRCGVRIIQLVITCACR
jgi:hypothetical protein